MPVRRSHGRHRQQTRTKRYPAPAMVQYLRIAHNYLRNHANIRHEAMVGNHLLGYLVGVYPPGALNLGGQRPLPHFDAL